MTDRTRSGSAPFVPRARLLKLLGGELIRDEVMAIVELVKNAHDADASFVRLDFRGVAGPDGSIVIEDDGHGMDLAVLLSSWMEPAGSTKRHKDRHYTAGGRRVLGEKGVGRFAVDRLGRYLDLCTRTRGSSTEVEMNFDWDQFDDATRLLSEVHSGWAERQALRMKGSGLSLYISSLRTTWTEKTFRRLCVRLQRLLSPFRSGKDFRIEIASDDFPDYSQTLETAFLDQAPYRLEASFDGLSSFSISVNGSRPSTHAWNGAGNLTCGPVKVNLYGFDLDNVSVARVGIPVEVRAWLRQWSGISVYRDHFRVLPYGEPDDDWLRLDQRRVNNPVVRLSNNQVCGFVNIARDANPDLRDQTNRGGLLQSRAFEDLRRLVLFLIQVLESERQLLRHPVREEEDPVRREQDGDEHRILGELRSMTSDLERKNGAAVKRLVGTLENAMKDGRQARDAELSTFIDLAAFGQSATIMGHSLRGQLGTLRAGLANLGLHGDGTDHTSMRTALSDMQDSLDQVEETLGYLASIGPKGKRQRRTINLNTDIRSFEKANLHILGEHGTKLECIQRGDELLRTELPPGVLQQVLYILLWNALEWMDPEPGGRIRITAGGIADECQLIFQDNGPGIADEHADKIFLPGFSLKEHGLGMGLPIARHVLTRHGGSMSLLRDRRRGKGACFEVRLKRRKSRTTGHRHVAGVARLD